MAVGRRDSATRAVGDTATAASQAATIIVTRAVVVGGGRGHHSSLIEARAATATQPPSPSEVHALGRVTEEEGVRRARTRSLYSELADGGPGCKKEPYVPHL